MGIKQALKRGRRLDQQIMTDECVITRATGEYEMNPDTGINEPVVEQVYIGQCRLQSAPETGRNIESGDHSYAAEYPRLIIPHDAEVRTGDEATITSTDTETIGAGSRMRLIDVNRGTHRTSQRWNVEVYT